MGSSLLITWAKAISLLLNFLSVELKCQGKNIDLNFLSLNPTTLFGYFISKYGRLPLGKTIKFSGKISMAFNRPKKMFIKGGRETEQNI